MKELDIQDVRSHFPALRNGWAFFDNAGGTQIVDTSVQRIKDYLINTNVQLGASYDVSQQAGARVKEAESRFANYIHARSREEVVFGSSTTALLQNLSRALVQTFQPGDEVIVTNCDHEANIGPWMAMKASGILVKIWKINPDSLQLELEDLEQLMTDRTRLVAFTHVSNILGTINPIQEFTEFVHERGALVCADGVAYAPHRLIDVNTWDVDFYVFSLYKVYGPHYSLLYGKKEHLEKLPGINHFFIGTEEVPYKLQPGNVNFELAWGCTGILDYFKTLASKHRNDHNLSDTDAYRWIFDLFARHEQELAEPLIDFLLDRKGIKIIGEPTADQSLRVPTIAFTSDHHKSSSIPEQLDKDLVAIRWGDFYARRLIEDLGLMPKDGIIRVSMVHYNSMEEVQKLIILLDQIL